MFKINRRTHLMKVNKKPCDGCGIEKVIWKNHQRKRYCKQCWSAHATSTRTKPTVKRKALPSRSQKRITQDKEYSAKRKIFLSSHPLCKANLSGICTNHSTDVHHLAGRMGDLYLDETNWLALCRSCHMWIETHLKEAREMGLSLSKI